MREIVGERAGWTDRRGSRRETSCHAEDGGRSVLEQILRATPVNATGLLSAMLLTTRDDTLTLDHCTPRVQDSLDYLEGRQTAR